MKAIRIDGSFLEGGGQIVRTAVGLSAATGQACHIVNIREGRRNPGLAAQHLNGVGAVAQACNATVEGAKMGSTALEFVPGPLDPPGQITAKVGTAGSVTLVLQALLIPLAVAGEPVEVTVSGGTHVNWSPTTDYFEQVFAWFLGRMGVGIEILDVRHGFYPRGGGQVTVSVTPGPLTPLELVEAGECRQIAARSIATIDLARARVAERQLEGARQVLSLDDAQYDYVQSPSTGTAVQMTATYENGRLGALALGERRTRAEVVGLQAARTLDRSMGSAACLDEHMADQILPYLALAGGTSHVRVAGITDHCRTNLWVIQKFLPVRFELDEQSGLISCSS